jgi:hypothetical protein
MRVEVSDEAARMVGERGGRLWVWDPDAWSARDRAVASRGSARPGAVAAVRAAELAGGVGSDRRPGGRRVFLRAYRMYGHVKQCKTRAPLLEPLLALAAPAAGADRLVCGNFHPT